MLEDVWVKEVYAAVYDVAHERAWLFHIMQDLVEKKKKKKLVEEAVMILKVNE